MQNKNIIVPDNKLQALPGTNAKTKNKLTKE